MTYEDLLVEYAQRDDRVMVLTAENRAAIRTIPERIGDRFIDVGIAEQTMIGMAAGLALRGRIPIVHALATFLTLRAFEFIRTDIGIGHLPVKIVGAVPGILSEANGPTHQAIEDISLLRGIPGMRVFCPSDIDDLLLGMPAIIEDPNPWYVRFNALARAIEHAPFEIGRAEQFGDGTDVAILTYGPLLREALDAADRLRLEGESVRVLHMRTLKPIDAPALLAAADDCEMLVVLEDHFLTGGLMSIVAETFLAHRRTARVVPISFAERWFRPGLLADVLRVEQMTGEAVARRITKELVSAEPEDVPHPGMPPRVPLI